LEDNFLFPPKGSSSLFFSCQESGMGRLGAPLRVSGGFGPSGSTRVCDPALCPQFLPKSY